MKVSILNVICPQPASGGLYREDEYVIMTTAEKEKYKCLLPSLSGSNEVRKHMANICLYYFLWFSWLSFSLKGRCEGVQWVESGKAAGAFIQTEQLLIQSKFELTVSVYCYSIFKMWRVAFHDKILIFWSLGCSIKMYLDYGVKCYLGIFSLDHDWQFWGQFVFTTGY